MSSPDVDIPEQMSYGQSFSDALNTQLQKLPEIYRAKKAYDPRFQELQQEDLARGMHFMADLYGGQGASGRIGEDGFANVMADIMGDARETDIQNNLAHRQQYGGQARDAYRASNPLFAELEDDALERLKTGGALSDQERSEVMDPILGQYAAAGRVFDDIALQDAVQGTVATRDRRHLQNQSTAMQLANFDPFLGISQPSQWQNLANANQGQANSFDVGELLNPVAGQQYIQDAHTNKANIAVGEANAKANYWGGLIGGVTNLAGGVAGGYISKG